MNAEPIGFTFQQDIYPKVISLLPTQPGTRVLDVGAGEGYLSKLMLERGYRVEACDFQTANFKVPGVPLHKADLSKVLPLADETYDCAVAVEVIEHIENHTVLVGEMMRVIRKGGTLILTTPNVLSISSRWHFLLYGFTDCAPLPLDPARPDYYLEHINPISLPEILFLVERFGGELVELTTNRLRRGSRVPAWLLAPFLRWLLKAKLLRPKHAALRPLYLRHIRWMLTPANLAGRITIAVARRVS